MAQGALMEANLFAGQHAFQNVVQVVDRVLSKSNGGVRAPDLWLARADAASALHHADAEDSYERAEASARKSKDDDKLAVILQRKAAFHIQSGAHAAASKE